MLWIYVLFLANVFCEIKVLPSCRIKTFSISFQSSQTLIVYPSNFVKKKFKIQCTLQKYETDIILTIFLFQIGYTAGYLFVSPVMEKINRKHLFIIASISMSSALTLLASCIPNSNGLNEAAVEDAVEVSTPLYVQIILPMAVVAFSFCYGAGFGPAVYTWSSELFPPR